MTLKKTFLTMIAVLIVGAGCLVLCFSYFAARFEKTTAEIFNQAASIRSADQVLIHLSRYSRQMALYDLTGDSEQLILKKKEEQALRYWLDLSQRLSTTEYEAQLVRQVDAKIQAFLQLRQWLENQKLSPADKLQKATASWQAAHRETEKLSDFNFNEALKREAKAKDDKQFAERVGAALFFATLLFFCIASAMMFRYVYQSVKGLQLSLVQFIEGDQNARAPAHGPAELAQIGVAFNRLADQLVNQNELRLRFLASVAHDLRTPLSAIKMSVDFLSSHSLANQEKSSLCAIIQRQASHLDRMVSDLLDASRIESGHLDLQMERVLLDSLVAGAVNLHRPLSAIHQIHYMATDKNITADCDPGRVSQVLNNLLSNAIKYSPHGGVIRVELTSEGDHALIRVHDDGMGISDEDRAHIFEPFCRTETTKSLIPGVGLGLSVSKKIVESHGGTINVQSRYGQGSTFTVSLPRVESLTLLPEIATC